MFRNFAFTPTGLVIGAVLAAPAMVHAQTPTLASATAKTVQVTLTQWGTRPAPVGKVAPLENLSKVHVTVDAANNKAFLQESDILPFNGQVRAPSLVAIDGKTQYETQGMPLQYVKSDATPIKEGPKSRLLSDAGLAIALGMKTSTLSKFVPASDETLNGKKLKVYVRTFDPREMNGKTLQMVMKLWVDPATNLPAQFSYISGIIGEGEPRELIRTEFSDWKLNAKLDNAKFAWTPPADMKAYSAPKRPELLAAGTVAPDFTAYTPEGKPVKLSDYRGKVVILDFWATWCGPCQMSMPHVEKVYQATKNKNVVVLGVCVWDTKDKFDAWIPANKSKYSFAFAFDPAGRGADSIARKLYSVSGIPTSYVIDKEGKIATGLVGFGGEDDVRLEVALGKLGISAPTSIASR